MASTSSTAFILFIRRFFTSSESYRRSGASIIQRVKLFIFSHRVHCTVLANELHRFLIKVFDDFLHNGITSSVCILFQCCDAINILRDTQVVFINRN